MVDFAARLKALKENKGKDFERLNQKVSRLSQKYAVDETQWYPRVGKDGNGFAVIRPLPAPEGEDSEFVRYFEHGFQGPKGWYIEKCRTTLGGQPDPVCEDNGALWQTGDKEKQAIVRKRRRNEYYLINA